ncbi:MAG: MarR family transcriptional regulator [Candidatus Bathyarchaeia archaeon]
MSQEELQWSTLVQIEVFENCSARWIVQRKATLKTEFDESLFFQYSNATSPDYILDNLHWMVDYASSMAGRTMSIENFELAISISRTVFGKEGILQYEFDWREFAEKTGDGEIKIGDAFGGEIDLLSDDILTIVYPLGYAPTTVCPSPDKVDYDKRALTWFGPANFGMGEPTIILNMERLNWISIIQNNATVLSASVTAILAGLLGYFLGKRRFYKKMELKPKIGEGELPFAGSEDDEEKILKLLSAAGGRLNQSIIAKQCGFSKSKTSGLLAEMERKGLISRKKSGRGKIVVLVQKSR